MPQFFGGGHKNTYLLLHYVSQAKQYIIVSSIDMRICFMATCSWDGNFPEQQGKTTANPKKTQKNRKKVSVSGVPQHFNIDQNTLVSC